MGERLADRLRNAGFIAPEEDAAQLLALAGDDTQVLDAAVRRRLAGEPLAWILGRTTFLGLDVRVDPGVYVPRWHSEPLAVRAAQRLPAEGVAVDLCTGSGAIARSLAVAHPRARVVASDIDERAVACANGNGVEAYLGDLFGPLPADLRGRVDVVVAVVPYVPTPALPFLQRDTFAFESTRSYDGGADGTDILRRVVSGSAEFLAPGGALLLELGGDQADALVDDLVHRGFAGITVHGDEEGDVRGIEATLERGYSRRAGAGAAVP